MPRLRGAVAVQAVGSYAGRSGTAPTPFPREQASWLCQNSGLDPDFGHRRGKKLARSESGTGHRKTRVGGLFATEP